MRYALLAVFITFSGYSDAGPYKDGWTQEHIENMTQECVVRLKANYFKKHKIDENDPANATLVSIIKQLAEQFRENCSCFTIEIAKNYEFYSVIENKNKIRELISELKANGECIPDKIK